ncbi:methyltransferase domain-containing protein [Rapidithrix thailandica]|uniref:Methyltransferase domain-containing protein n=1 Tax=Rapidithrix thailandica TaxID=413964 RepID=A0AAW9SDA3_9BACT
MGLKNTQKGHSEVYFGDYRDYWWNRDYLDLIAERLGLERHRKLLDVGCGLCHWSKLLVNYLAASAHVVGLDNDEKWTQKNNKVRKHFQELGARFELINGDAHKLPFEDNSFDLVTCQTVLIHVKKPKKVIKEMKRVLKPGGTILCVEPNNLVQNLMKSSLSDGNTIDEVLDHVKFALICEKGKKKLGMGDSSLGDLVPGMLAEAGFDEVEVCLSDKAIPMYPPYERQEQVATLKQWGNTTHPDLQPESDYKYFEAFGGRYLDFYENYQKKYQGAGEDFLNSLVHQQYHAAGGAVMYIVSGTKPE